VESSGENASNLVVIGASAGAVESLSTLIATLPEDFPAPIVVALHLNPKRVSTLGEAIARRASLPVQTISERVVLEPGTIYVVPSNHHVRIIDDQAMLNGDVPLEGPLPSIDLLFRSAAEAYGENLIAVMLSGTGADGTAGAREVKCAGGTVIFQNPDTAAYPAMPLSLPPFVVDVIASIDKIGNLLTEFVTGGFAVPPPSEHSLLQSFLEELRENSGVDFTSYRQATIQRRVQRRMAATGHPVLGDYLRFVREYPEERRRLTTSFLINVTQFFRDPDLFEYLREKVLPELLREAANREEDLRIWSAGCSTGEEAYSIAIAVSELLEQEGLDVNVRIFATDLDDEAVAFARRGFFAARSLSDLPPELISKYFMAQGDEYEVRKSLRGMLIFGEHDLSQRAPFPRINLILCRNVLIYFTQALQRHALHLFAFSLRNGGYLVLGKSETVSPLVEYFAPDQSRLKVFRRVGERALIPSSRIRDMIPSEVATQQGTLRQPGTQVMAATRRPPAESSGTHRGWKGDYLLHGLPFGLVIVDRTYDIHFINGQARRLFEIHSTALDQDLIHLVRQFDPLQLRRMVDEAVQTGQVTTGHLDSTGALAIAKKTIEVVCTPLTGGDDEHGIFVAITILDVTEREYIRRQQLAADEIFARLSNANDEVLAANQSLTLALSRLREENEQMAVASAEIQAATEEVETLNEELQASNEELETLNEELQATVEELNTTNDDLHARTLELQTLALKGEASRQQLRAILDAIDEAIIVVDQNGSVMLENACYTERFDGSVTSLDFTDARGEPLDPGHSPILLASRGETFSLKVQVQSRDGVIRPYQALGRPAIVGTGPRVGVVTIRPLD
jgi:two-component system CheB/CheR fusion protein